MHLGITDRVNTDAVAVELVSGLLFLRLSGSLFTLSTVILTMNIARIYACLKDLSLANYLAHVNTAKSF